jgi:8-oxo-dGDP phosphatase
MLAARRELAEEVGLAADTWHRLVDLFSTPGIVGERLLIFLARDLHPVAAPDGFVKAGEEAELELAWAPLDDLVQAVLAGELHNPTLVSGVLATHVARSRDGFASLRAGNRP